MVSRIQLDLFLHVATHGTKPVELVVNNQVFILLLLAQKAGALQVITKAQRTARGTVPRYYFYDVPLAVDEVRGWRFE